MTEHTKTPWRVEQGTDLIWGACNPDDPTSYGMGYSIVQGHSASYLRGKPDMDEREANAAFITKAVNAHEEAISLLESAATRLWAVGANGLARNIDDFLERIAPDSDGKIESALSLTSAEGKSNG